jgi:formylglycine-generating enzyme required for sulfatase activity
MSWRADETQSAPGGPHWITRAFNGYFIMFRTSRPLSHRIFTAQDGIVHCDPPTEAVPELTIDDAGALRSEMRSGSSLRQRLQSQSASFAFDALLPSPAVPEVSQSTATNTKDGAAMVWIPPGWFCPGPDGPAGSGAAESQFLAGFWIYKSPVTVAQYRAFYTEIGRTLRHAPRWGWDDEHPMVNVSWDFAAAYADWAGGSLPSDAEWEWAARGADGRRFPWGDDWYASRCRNSVAARQFGPAKVCSHPHGATPDGVEDMAGNVWEWTADWFVPRRAGAASMEFSARATQLKHRTLRGGSWGNDAIADFCARTRVPCEPEARGESIGFRCVVHPTMAPSLLPQCAPGL